MVIKWLSVTFCFEAAVTKMNGAFVVSLTLDSSYFVSSNSDALWPHFLKFHTCEVYLFIFLFNFKLMTERRRRSNKLQNTSWVCELSLLNIKPYLFLVTIVFAAFTWGFVYIFIRNLYLKHPLFGQLIICSTLMTQTVRWQILLFCRPRSVNWPATKCQTVYFSLRL